MRTITHHYALMPFRVLAISFALHFALLAPFIFRFPVLRNTAKPDFIFLGKILNTRDLSPEASYRTSTFKSADDLILEDKTSFAPYQAQLPEKPSLDTATQRVFVIEPVFSQEVGFPKPSEPFISDLEPYKPLRIDKP